MKWWKLTSWVESELDGGQVWGILYNKGYSYRVSKGWPSNPGIDYSGSLSWLSLNTGGQGNTVRSTDLSYISVSFPPSLPSCLPFSLTLSYTHTPHGCTTQHTHTHTHTHTNKQTNTHTHSARHAYMYNNNKCNNYILLLITRAWIAQKDATSTIYKCDIMHIIAARCQCL